MGLGRVADRHTARDGDELSGTQAEGCLAMGDEATVFRREIPGHRAMIPLFRRP